MERYPYAFRSSTSLSVQKHKNNIQHNKQKKLTKKPTVKKRGTPFGNDRGRNRKKLKGIPYAFRSSTSLSVRPFSQMSGALPSTSATMYFSPSMTPSGWQRS